jgi:hypothetical protein
MTQIYTLNISLLLVVLSADTYLEFIPLGGAANSMASLWLQATLATAVIYLIAKVASKTNLFINRQMAEKD